MLKYHLPGMYIFTHFRLVSMGGKGDTPAARPGLSRQGGAGLGGVKCLRLPYPHLGGVCSPSVFFKVCLGLRSVILPARGILVSSRANVAGKSALRPVDLLLYSRRVSTGSFCRLFFSPEQHDAGCSAPQ